MSVSSTASSVSPHPRIDTISPSETWTSSTARSVTRWGRAGAVISVDGEIDAANSQQFADHVHSCAAHCQWLVIDLHNLEFIGTAGFSVLLTISAWCADARVHCTVVSGAALSRLVPICDPDRTLRTAESVTAALQRCGLAANG